MQKVELIESLNGADLVKQVNKFIEDENKHEEILSIAYSTCWNTADEAIVYTSLIHYRIKEIQPSKNIDKDALRTMANILK